MRYTYFEIKNFKGIRKLRLDLDVLPRNSIHTLVGLNECGKTTILEAIDYFTRGDEDLGPTELAGYGRIDKHDLIPVAERANFNGEIVVRAGVELDDNDLKLLKEHLRASHHYRLNDITRQFSVEDVYNFTDSKFVSHRALWAYKATGRRSKARKDSDLYASDRLIWLAGTAFLKRRMPPIWYFPNFLFEFPRRIYLAGSPTDTNSDRFYRTLLQDILDAVDMVMAEGKNDYYVLTYMHDVILELGLDLHFLPGGGAGSLDQMIRLYLGWARRFVVLLDSDAEGMRQKSRYAGLFGPIVESRIVTLGDLASDLVGKSMEGVFDLKDLDAIQSIVPQRGIYKEKVLSCASRSTSNAHISATNRCDHLPVLTTLK